MKLILTFLLLATSILTVQSQNLYLKSFGNPKDKAIIFLHGGPGYNSASFEATTAQKLSDNGFFVVVYDRRGEGRSEGLRAEFTFEETFDDLKSIYKKFKIKKAILIGHSFGGIVATLFAEKYPRKIKSVVLVGAPVSFQESFKTIISKCRTIYENNLDIENLNYMDMLEKMDTASIQYSSYCFMHAMQNNFYSPKVLSEEAISIYAKFKADSVLVKYASKMTIPPPSGFWKNEKYTTINLTENISHLLHKKVAIYGLYGKEDGLYSEQQVMHLQKQLGINNLQYLDNCSHSVFIDQQTKFIEAIVNWAK